MSEVIRLLAPNPGPLTLDGTNTWVLRAAPGRPCLVVDPGPDDEAHLDAVAGQAPVALILLTHGHPDHAEGAARLAARTGAPLHACRAVPGHPTTLLADGQVLEVDGVRLTAVFTPGHSADSVCFTLAERRVVFTGDTVLGRGTSVVAHPDGRLADYLASLRRLRRLAAADVDTILPGHGDPVHPAAPRLDAYLRHRAERLAQVEAAVAAGAGTAPEVVRLVYADVDRRLWPAAEASVRAQLEYLAAGGSRAGPAAGPTPGR